MNCNRVNFMQGYRIVNGFRRFCAIGHTEHDKHAAAYEYNEWLHIGTFKD